MKRLVVALVVLGAVMALTEVVARAATSWVPVATYQMDEGPRQRVLHDAVNGINGTIGSEIVRKGEFFRFKKYPYKEPLDPEKTARVYSDELNPGSDDFMIVWRQRTTHTLNGANVMQKGQGSPDGGMFKFKNGMNGKDYMRVSCFWRGADGNNAFTQTPVGVDFRDGQWHKIACGRVDGQTVMRVDGKLVDTDDPFGPIDNSWPLAIGGNFTSCEDVGDDGRHCNYWGGDLDWIKFRRMT